MTDQSVPPTEQPVEPVNPAPVEAPVPDAPAQEPATDVAPVDAPTQPDSVAPHTSDALPEIVNAPPAPTAGELRAAGYVVPEEIPDDEVPHKYAGDTRANPGDPPVLVDEFPPHGVPRWEDGKVVGGDEA